ncbi:hypothetical protein [Halobaculum limi]|uniref:hypothetical protein n=1 Tax=Halobaculum limi TaxID=3031916 RepID=UPI002404EE96|nr:hypothetical protein [Halobaculum sp. YSMS11]
MTASLGAVPAAVSATHDCSGLDMSIATFAAGIDAIIIGDPIDSVNYDKCGRTHSSSSVQVMKELDAEQEWGDYYQSYATSHEEQRQEHAKTVNSLQDSDTVVWTRMQFDANQDYKDGNLTLAQYQQAGYSAARDYYAAQQVLALESAETHMGDISYQINRAEMEDGIGANETLNVGLVTQDGTIVEGDAIENESYTSGSENVTYRLANGEQHTIQVLTVTDTDTGDTTILSPVDPKFVVEPSSYNGSFSVQYRDSWTPADGNTAGSWGENTNGTALVAVAPPDSNSSDTVAYDPSLYNNEFYRMDTSREQLEDNFAGFAEGLYPALENGTVTPDEATPAAGWIDATDPSKLENHYIYKVATLSSAGWETPDLNQTGTMTLQYQGNNYTGLLVTETSPAGGWVVGTEYNTSDVDGRESFIRTDGGTVDLENDTTFTITSATGPNGEALDTVSTTRPTRITYNNSEYIAMLDNIETYAEEIEEREPDGGGAGDGPGVAWWQAGLIAAAAFGALYAMSMRRDDDERLYGGQR